MAPPSVDTFLTASRIIALCRGNTCRSPFVEGYLRSAATRIGYKLPPLLSRGLTTRENEPSSPIAIASARKFSVDLHLHRSKSIFAETPQPADLYLLVDPQHEPELREWSGPLGSILFIGNFDPLEPDPLIIDPYHGNSDTYDRTYARLQRACDGLLQTLPRA